jgi:hypothetical protein
MIVQTRLLAISIPSKDFMIQKEIATNLWRHPLQLRSMCHVSVFSVDGVTLSGAEAAV